MVLLPLLLLRSCLTGCNQRSHLVRRRGARGSAVAETVLFVCLLLGAAREGLQGQADELGQAMCCMDEPEVAHPVHTPHLIPGDLHGQAGLLQGLEDLRGLLALLWLYLRLRPCAALPCWPRPLLASFCWPIG